MIDFKGTPYSVSIAGDRGHEFAMPRDIEALHPKVAAAFHALVEAQRTEQATKGANGTAAKMAAHDVTRSALGELYDVAASTSKTARGQYAEAYDYGARRFARALAEAESALQSVVTAAQLHDQAEHGHGVGLNPAAKSRALMMARLIADTFGQLPALPALDAE